MPDRPLPPDLRDALDGRPDADALRRVWDSLHESDPYPLPLEVPTDDDALASVRSRIARPSTRAQDRPPMARREATRRRRWGATAAVLAAVVVAWGIWSAPVTIQSGAGEVQVAELPDGSRVQLAAGSTVRYRRGFRTLSLVRADERRVMLQGEAFFEVETDARPFRVETFNATVEVLGTRFNVRARAGDRDASTVVAVEEGRVRVAGSGDARTLLAGGTAAVSLGSLDDAMVPTERIGVWRRGGFAVEDAPLGDVLDEVERRFGVVADADPGVPLDVAVTVYYGADATAEVVVHDLALAAGLRYRPVAGGFALTAE